jgi:hypothetical protein
MMKRLFFLVQALCIAAAMQAQITLQANTSTLNEGFIENKGQIYDQKGKPNKQVRYINNQGNFQLALNSNSFSYELIEYRSNRPLSESGEENDNFNSDGDLAADENFENVYSRIDVTLPGANVNPEIIAVSPLSGSFNYYRSTETKDIFLNVKRYQKIVYKDIYDGIDLEFSYNDQYNRSPLEYRFVVHPGADPSLIHMSYSGSRFLTINKDGDLVMGNPVGEITEHGLKAYEEENGNSVLCHYKLIGNQTTTFDIKTNSSNTIVIDPEIVWGSYFGGKGSENFDTESEIKVDHEGKIVLSGSTTSNSMISTTGGYQSVFAGIRDMFISRFNPDGHTLVFATYIGGADKDVIYGLDLDTANNILVAGLTHSAGLATAGSFKSVKTGLSDMYIGKFTSMGQMIWATYVGGSNDHESEHLRGIQCMPNNEFYVCGYITSTDAATAGAFQVTYGGGGDAFLGRFDANGFPKWLTYYGGLACDRGHTVCVSGGSVYFTGTFKSKTGMASTGAYQIKGNAGTESFLAKFDTSGQRIWATYYGGEGFEHGRGVVVDGSGNVYINGWTNSFAAIATPGSYIPVKDPTIKNGAVNDDGYLAKFGPNGNLLWGTYLGGEASEYVFNLIQDPQENMYICGKTGSNNNIATPDGFKLTRSGTSVDGFILRTDTSGHVIWGTYFGGPGVDEIYDLDLDMEDNLYFNLSSDSALTTTPGAYQETKSGGVDIGVFSLMIQKGCSDNFEINETRQTASVIDASQNPLTYGFCAKINGSTDEDWYKITVNKTWANIKVILTEMSVPMNIELYNVSGILLVQTSLTGTQEKVLFYNSSVNGTYTIHILHDSTATDTTGCYRLAVIKSKTPFMSPMKTQFKTAANLTFDLFPNPSSSEINITMSVPVDGIMTQYITDLMGHEIMVQSGVRHAGINQWKIDTTQFPSGIYKLTCKGESYSVSQSFVISR